MRAYFLTLCINNLPETRKRQYESRRWRVQAHATENPTTISSRFGMRWALRPHRTIVM